MIEERYKREFQRDGCVLFDSYIPDQELSVLREKTQDVIKAARNGRISKIRVYEDMPRVFGGLNVAGIEDPFFYIPELSRWIATSGLGDTVASLTEWPGAELEVARLHVTGRFKHRGFWHRDCQVTEPDKSLVAVVYLEDETGFRVVPADSKWSRYDLPFGDQIQQKHYFGSLEDERIVSASCGSVFCFKSYLLHQPFCTRPRAHLHLRFRKSETPGFDTAKWAAFRAPDLPDFDPESSTTAQRLVRLVNYFLPRKNRSNLYQT